MEWATDKVAVLNALKKYRYVILAVLTGMLLMQLPEKKDTNNVETIVVEQIPETDSDLQNQLSEFLSQLEGAGKVQVLLTEAVGQQTIFQSDQNIRKTVDSEEQQTETLILSKSDRDQVGLISRIDPPQYMGAVVLCQGADKASVRLAIVDAVSTATGLGTDKISVWKMK